MDVRWSRTSPNNGCIPLRNHPGNQCCIRAPAGFDLIRSSNFSQQFPTCYPMWPDLTESLAPSNPRAQETSSIGQTSPSQDLSSRKSCWKRSQGQVWLPVSLHPSSLSRTSQRTWQERHQPPHYWTLTLPHASEQFATSPAQWHQTSRWNGRQKLLCKPNQLLIFLDLNQTSYLRMIMMQPRAPFVEDV